MRTAPFRAFVPDTRRHQFDRIFDGETVCEEWEQEPTNHSGIAATNALDFGLNK